MEGRLSTSDFPTCENREALNGANYFDFAEDRFFVCKTKECNIGLFLLRVCLLKQGVVWGSQKLYGRQNSI